MKKILVTVIIALVFVFGATAQTKQEKAVGNAVEQLRKAMVDADRSMMDHLVSEHLSYGHSGGYIDDKKEFIEKIVSGKSDFVSIDQSEQTIRVCRNVAMVRHILSAKTNDGGKPGEVHLRILLVWQKIAGKWKLLARQAVKIS